MLVVQHIGTIWSKASRGGEEARRRNASPHALPLPLEVASKEGLLHFVFFNEHDNFVPHETSQSLASLTAPLRQGCVTIQRDEGGTCQVAFRWTNGKGGAPERSHCRRNLTLPSGQWCQVLWNGRFTDPDSGRWWYEKHVVNVGWGEFTRQHFRLIPPISFFQDFRII